MISGDKTGAAANHGDKEGEFDSTHIVMKKWAEFERERRWKSGTQSRDSMFYNGKTDSNRYSLGTDSDTFHPPSNGFDSSTIESAAYATPRQRHDSNTLLMLPAPLAVNRQPMSSNSSVSGARSSEDAHYSDHSDSNLRLVPSLQSDDAVPSNFSAALPSSRYSSPGRSMDSPQGSQGLKAVTTAKLGYNPIELDPELMTPYAMEQPHILAQYSVSDAVATYYLYMKYVHPFIFSLCTIIPLCPDEVLRKGSGTLCETLLMAEAYRGHIIMLSCPTDTKRSTETFMTDIFWHPRLMLVVTSRPLKLGYPAVTPTDFKITPSAVQQLINDLDAALTFCIVEESKSSMDKVTNYNEVKCVTTPNTPTPLPQPQSLSQRRMQGAEAKGKIVDLKETVNTMVLQLFYGTPTLHACFGGQAFVQEVQGEWKGLTDNVNLMAINLKNQVRIIAASTTVNTINDMIDQLRIFAVEGKLGVQAEVGNVQGIWQEITLSVNTMAGSLTTQVRGFAQSSQPPWMVTLRASSLSKPLFKLDNGKSLAFSYPCTMLNHLVYAQFTNHQYHDPDPETGEYKIHSENSIFFELDNPYRAMILPSSEEEDKLLKKRYAVFNDDGSLAELKGFEVKRRGELQLIKFFQSQIFEKFLLGRTTEECYKANTLTDEELVELIAENRSMSRTLAEYGGQKSTSINSELIPLPLRIPREFYVHLRTPKEEIFRADFYSFEKDLYREIGEHFIDLTNDPNVDGVFELQVPLTVRGLLKLGRVCESSESSMTLNRAEAIGYDLHQLETPPSSSDSKHKYLRGGKNQKYIFLYHACSANSPLHVFAVFFPTGPVKLHIVDPATRRQSIPHLQEIYAEIRKKRDARFGQSNSVALKAISWELGVIEDQSFILVLSSSKDDLYFEANVPKLAKFPVLSMAKARANHTLDVFPWQSHVSQRMLNRYLSMGGWLDRLMVLSEYYDIPIGHIEDMVLWWSSSELPDLGGIEIDKRPTDDLPKTEFVVPGAYANVCLEVAVRNLAINSVVHSLVVNELEGSGGSTAFDSVSRTLDEYAQGDQRDISLGESNVPVQTFGILKLMVKAWLTDRLQSELDGVDSPTIVTVDHFWRWISSSASNMYDPSIHCFVHGLMRKTFVQLLAEFKRLGSHVVYADFSKIVLATSKPPGTAPYYYPSCDAEGAIDKFKQNKLTELFEPVREGETQEDEEEETQLADMEDFGQGHEVSYPYVFYTRAQTGKFPLLDDFFRSTSLTLSPGRPKIQQHIEDTISCTVDSISGPKSGNACGLFDTDKIDPFRRDQIGGVEVHAE
ncbi:DUF1744-domain-containing protein [Gymnopus androsaceus JB14]|uniref:DNA polymerase epsilon catalytic subunit n=1 Tax=Gymnopus androsaceus JB14 TaxID=1447944 RepID=A0A6A4I8N6_9AGAR|nr:DUF1744-domain-containing protein [Gymnopus androsaceus JB14]